MHPLELPELLHRVGWFTTAWKPSKKDPDLFTFYPKDLIACTQVSHTWRRLMVPLLWSVYDENRMEGWNIPGGVLQAASEHFRFISLGTPWPANTIRPSHLQELRIAARALVNNLQLLHDNPQLTLLRMWFSDSAMYNEIQPAIESLTRLQSLYFDFLHPKNWDHLTIVLNNNPDLRNLAFRHPRGIMGFDECEPLVQLTLLHFTGDWDRNPGILRLIQLCPRLERLEIPAAGCPTSELVANLRACPFLNAIQCEGHFADEEDASLLIRAATRLLHLELTVIQFSACILGALMGHAKWIESLKLRLREDDEVNSRSLAITLDRCTNLRSLDIVRRAIDVEYPDPRLNWIDSPWNAPRLESISLLGLTYPYVSGAETGVFLANSWLANSRSQAQRQAAIESKRGLAQSCLDQGWAFDRCTTVGYDDKRISDSARAIRDAVFRRVSDSPRMHKIVIEDFTYLNKSRVPWKK
ncbi:hypothetical protein BG000_007495 [Podila horticola]|nr:hypothetical protein BG000_007495 [Podila horticola]